jgi:hypothetical protein
MGKAALACGFFFPGFGSSRLAPHNPFGDIQPK